MSSNKWMGVDLDGTLAYQDPNTDNHSPYSIGEPIPAMADRVKFWISQGIEVRIFTSRMTPSEGRDISKVRKVIEMWSLTHIGEVLLVTNIKDHGLIKLWDDRAVGIVINTGVICCERNDRHE